MKYTINYLKDSRNYPLRIKLKDWFSLFTPEFSKQINEEMILQKNHSGKCKHLLTGKRIHIPEPGELLDPISFLWSMAKYKGYNELTYGYIESVIRRVGIEKGFKLLIEKNILNGEPFYEKLKINKLKLYKQIKKKHNILMTHDLKLVLISRDTSMGREDLFNKYKELKIDKSHTNVNIFEGYKNSNKYIIDWYDNYICIIKIIKNGNITKGLVNFLKDNFLINLK